MPVAAALLAFAAPTARAQEPVTGGTDRPGVEVMVFGTGHLRQMNPDDGPVAVDVVRSSLARYEPDLIVVEWLHPSIDRSKAFNYRSLGDLETLGHLWGFRTEERVAEAFDETLAELARLKSAQVPTGATRVRLGKLHYLLGDQLNAGYQWWRAQRLGADVSDLRRLTSDNFRGHELEVWGFELAALGDHEYLTPFDYQGPDTGSDVWGRLLVALRERALSEAGLRPGAPAWGEAIATYDSLRVEFEAGRSDAWVDRYGDVREVAEYARAWAAFGELADAAPAEDPNGLRRIRWWQSADYDALERRVQHESIVGISIGGLGRARTDGNILRNERMADFVAADVERLGATRVLVIVGSAHKHYLEDAFESRGYRVVPSADFVP